MEAIAPVLPDRRPRSGRPVPSRAHRPSWLHCIGDSRERSVQHRPMCVGPTDVRTHLTAFSHRGRSPPSASCPGTLASLYNHLRGCDHPCRCGPCRSLLWSVSHVPTPLRAGPQRLLRTRSPCGAQPPLPTAPSWRSRRRPQHECAVLCCVGGSSWRSPTCSAATSARWRRCVRAKPYCCERNEPNAVRRSVGRSS